MKGGKPIFLRRIEIHHIQCLLAKRGKRMDWGIIKDIEKEIGVPFNRNAQEISKKEEVIFIRQREIDHILHHLYLNRSEYSRKIIGLIGEQTGLGFDESRSCFTDYSSSEGG